MRSTSSAIASSAGLVMSGRAPRARAPSSSDSARTGQHHPALKRPAVRGAVAGAIVLVASAGLRAEASAQAATRGATVVLAPGARVRVTSSATGRIVGTLVPTGPDSIGVALGAGSSIVLSNAGISRVELSAGVRRQGWRGAGVGLLAGAGMGGVIGLATYRRTHCEDPVLDVLVCSFVDRTSRSVTVIADAAIGGTVGAIAGALIGQVAREQWIRVPVLPDGTRIGWVSPSATHGPGLGLAIAY
jgi:hypothetical protein